MTRRNGLSLGGDRSAGPERSAGVKRVIVWTALLSLASMTACTHERAMPDDIANAAAAAPSTFSGTRSGARASAATLPESQCSPDEAVLISCRIEGTDDVASICVSPDASGSAGYVYFASGPLTRPDVVVPRERSPAAGRFKLASFERPGGAGSGYAYTFEDDREKYIFYSVNSTGDAGLGLITQPLSGAASEKEKCEQSTAREVADDSTYRLTRTWPRDIEIEGRGLPSNTR